MASNPSADLVLTPLTGKGFPLRAWLVNYHLLLVAVDPFTNEGSWILKTAIRVLENFEQADVRVGFVLAGATPAQAREFLGPYAKTILAFPDRHHEIVKAFGFDRLPAIVHVNMDGSVVNAAEGWFPTEWQTVTDALAQMMSWTGPVLPHPADPGAFEGSPALG